MEDLIKQAFLHIEVIGPHVAEGHYDLVGPNGDIILPQVWETVVEPDWTITMHMWPIPEKPKEPDPPAADSPAPAKPDAAATAPEKKKDGGMCWIPSTKVPARDLREYGGLANANDEISRQQETQSERRHSHGRGICQLDDGWAQPAEGQQGPQGREKGRTGRPMMW
jgi:hypothetical protein